MGVPYFLPRQQQEDYYNLLQEMRLSNPVSQVPQNVKRKLLLSPFRSKL